VAAALRHAVKYVAYLVTPVAALLISAAPSLFELIYTRTYSSGIIYLQLLSIANLPIVLGATVLPTFFSGVGRTRLAMVATASGAIVLLVLAPLLGAVSSLGVAGLIYAILLSTLAGNIVGLVLAARYMHISIDYRSAVGVLAASLLALGLTLPMVLLLLPAVVTLLGQIVVFTVVYFTAVPLLRGIDHDDVVRLEVATRGLGPLAVMARPILRFERRILELS
jgi:O-antigen/teichoic acid export membrane protein